MASRRRDNNSLSEPMIVNFIDAHMRQAASIG